MPSWSPMLADLGRELLHRITPNPIRSYLQCVARAASIHVHLIRRPTSRQSFDGTTFEEVVQISSQRCSRSLLVAPPTAIESPDLVKIRRDALPGGFVTRSGARGARVGRPRSFRSMKAVSRVGFLTIPETQDSAGMDPLWRDIHFKAISS